MNKDSKEYQRIREEIALFLSELPDWEWNDLTREEKEEWYYDADLLLSIKGLAILAGDQSLPRNRYGDYHEHRGVYAEAQRDMERAGFRKVIEAEGQ